MRSAQRNIVNKMGTNLRTQLTLFLLIVIGFGIASKNAVCAQYLTPEDIKQLPFAPADQRIHYGSESEQFGDLRLPKGLGPHPVLVVIHGGCWSCKKADLNFMAAFSEAFTQKGLATWNIEYRCIENPGGGWPGTFADVGNAIDHLQTMAKQYHLDLTRVVIIGHSAGGHLALWSGARGRLPNNSFLRSKNMLPLKGIIDLGGPGDLAKFIPMEEFVCTDKVVSKLLGGPEVLSKSIHEASPIELLPLGVKQVLITGDHDTAVPPELGQQYVAAAKEAGDNAQFILVKDAGHFEVIAPNSIAWPIVKNAVMSLI